jgi:hypothetical protein
MEGSGISARSLGKAGAEPEAIVERIRMLRRKAEGGSPGAARDLRGRYPIAARICDELYGWQP